MITKDTKLQNFQLKLLHRILPVNSFLYKWGLQERELCTFCTETKENMLHLFWNCTFLFSVKNFLMICGIARPLHAWEITLRMSESCIENQNTINHILLSLKCYICIYIYIYRCWCKGEIPHIHGSIPQMLYKSREKLHFLHIPETDRKFIN